MIRTYEGNFKINSKKIVIIVSRFNEFITSKLLDGCIDGLKRHGLVDDNIEIIWTPGAFEIPQVANICSKSDKYDGIICLGCVIRGDTDHYQLVSSEVTKGIANVSMSCKKPVIFGVLTTDNIDQAIERAGTKAGNKGFDCALSAIEMLNVIEKIK